MNILTRNFASTRPVQIATQCASRTVRVQAFASTRSAQIATVKSIGNRLHTIFASTRSVQIATAEMHRIAICTFQNVC